MNILMCLFLGWVLDRIQMHVTFVNYDSVFNGFGAIESVQRKDAKAPMAYRVILPWGIWLVEKLGVPDKQRVTVYETFKVLSIALALGAVWNALGFEAMVLTCVFIPLTYLYDYWDWPIEMMAVYFAMSGNVWLGLAGCVLLAMSKETAPIVPLVYLFATWDWMGTGALMLVTLGVMAGIRLIVGKRALYCERWQLIYNLKMMSTLFRWKPVFFGSPVLALIVTGLALLGALSRAEGLPLLGLILAGWVLAKADETRVFAACLPLAAAFLMGG